MPTIRILLVKVPGQSSKVQGQLVRRASAKECDSWPSANGSHPLVKGSGPIVRRASAKECDSHPIVRRSLPSEPHQDLRTGSPKGGEEGETKSGFASGRATQGSPRQLALRHRRGQVSRWPGAASRAYRHSRQVRANVKVPSREFPP